jgi:hypothetical protein
MRGEPPPKNLPEPPKGDEQPASADGFAKTPARRTAAEHARQLDLPKEGDHGTSTAMTYDEEAHEPAGPEEKE